MHVLGKLGEPLCILWLRVSTQLVPGSEKAGQECELVLCGTVLAFHLCKVSCMVIGVRVLTCDNLLQPST